MQCTIDSILKYSNTDVLERFCRNYDVTLEDATDIFHEMLKMLWIMELHQNEFQAGTVRAPTKFLVYKPMTVLDEMWHTFILFSREYSRFCDEIFGHYLHHAPTTSKDRVLDRTKMANEIKDQCHYIAQKFGIETLRLWFKIFPERFSKMTS